MQINLDRFFLCSPSCVCMCVCKCVCLYIYIYIYLYIYELPPNTNTRDEKSERELDWIGVKSLCQLNSTQLNINASSTRAPFRQWCESPSGWAPRGRRNEAVLPVPIAQTVKAGSW